jgi:hypothetical protein
LIDLATPSIVIDRVGNTADVLSLKDALPVPEILDEPNSLLALSPVIEKVSSLFAVVRVNEPLTYSTVAKAVPPSFKAAFKMFLASRLLFPASAPTETSTVLVPILKVISSSVSASLND